MPAERLLLRVKQTHMIFNSNLELGYRNLNTDFVTMSFNFERVSFTLLDPHFF